MESFWREEDEEYGCRRSFLDAQSSSAETIYYRGTRPQWPSIQRSGSRSGAAKPAKAVKSNVLRTNSMSMSLEDYKLANCELLI